MQSFQNPWQEARNHKNDFADSAHIFTSSVPESMQSLEEMTKHVNLMNQVMSQDQQHFDLIAHLPGSYRNQNFAGSHSQLIQIIQQTQQKPQKGIKGKQPKHQTSDFNQKDSMLNLMQKQNGLTLMEEQGLHKDDPRASEVQRTPEVITFDRFRQLNENNTTQSQQQYSYQPKAQTNIKVGLKDKIDNLGGTNISKAHFFESNSKYFPLKTLAQPDKSKLVADKYLLELDHIIQKWFRALSFADKAIALTIVDKELVSLFKAMYKVDGGQGYSGGKFTAHLDEFKYGTHSDCSNVPGYKLIYIKPKNVRSAYQSSTMREKEQAVSELIEHVRIITVNSPNDALTIDVDLISNMDYFMKIMKLIDDEFLMREYRVTKETNLEGSLLLPQVETKRPYFHINDRQKQIYFSMQGAVSMQISGEVDFGSPNTQVNLAKCLLLSFEKALNVHHLDCQKKMALPQQQQFILKESEITCNPFEQDLRLANWWLTLNQARKQQYLEYSKNLEKQIIVQYNSIKSKFEDIKEQEEAEDIYDDHDRIPFNQVIRGLQMQQLQYDPTDTYAATRRRGRKDRQRDGKGSSSSNSGMLQYDYTQRQLISQYGDLSDSDENDLEIQRKKATPVTPRNDLFGSDKTDNTIFRCRQTLVGKGLGADDYQKCLHFFKQISTFKSFEVLIHENKDGTQFLKKVSDLVASLYSQFYKYLDEAFQKSVIDELYDLSSSQDKKKQKKKQTKNRRKKQKEERDVEIEEPPQHLAVADELMPEISISFSKPQEQPVISGHKEDQNTSMTSSDDYDAKILRLRKAYEFNKQHEENQLFAMEQKLESLNRQDMQEVYSDNYDGGDFLERQLTESTTVCNEQLVMNSKFHKTMIGFEPMRYNEERTGLLTNQVHLEKYINEAEFFNEKETIHQRQLTQYLMKSSLNYSPQLSSNEEVDSDRETVQMIRRYCQEKPQVQETVQEESKPQQLVEAPEATKTQNENKKQRKNKKARRKRKQIQQQEVNNLEQAASFGRQVDQSENDLDVISCSNEPVQQKKPILQVRKNNFFNDDTSSVSSNCPSQVTYIQKDQDLKQEKEVKDREQYVTKLTQKIINNAVDAVKASDEKKAPQKQRNQKQIRELVPVSNKMCCLTPLMSSVTIEPQILLSKFEADLSDKVKIPSRGKSISSYGKEELLHTQTLQELDSLFPSPNGAKTKSSARGSSTDDKKNRPYSDVNELLLDEPSDVVSQKIPRTNTQEQDLTGYKKIKLSIENQITTENIQAISSKQKGQKQGKYKRQKKEEQLIEDAISQVVIEPVVKEELKPNTVQQDSKIQFEKPLEAKLSEQFKGKSQNPRMRPESETTKVEDVQVERQSQNKKDYPMNNTPTETLSKRKDQTNNKKQQQQANNSSTQKSNNKSHQNKPTHQKQQTNQSKQQSQQQQSNTQIQLQAATVNISTTFDSYDTMFQQVFGAELSSPKHKKPSELASKSDSTILKKEPEPVSKAEETKEVHSVSKDESSKTLIDIITKVSQAIETQEHSPTINPEHKQKLTKKQQKKQQTIAECGIMTTATQRSFNLTSSNVQVQKIQTHNKTITIYKQRQPTENMYASSSFQTPEPPMPSERGASFPITHMNSQVQQNVTMNFNFPNFQMNDQMNFNQQQQIFQQMQFNQSQQYLAQQMHLSPVYMQQQNNWPQNQQYYHQFSPQFQFVPQTPCVQKAPFFEIVTLSNSLDIDTRTCRQQHEDQFHLALGQSLLAVQNKIDTWLQESEQFRVLSFELVCRVIRDTYPELSLQFDIYGSMATKLAIDTSDMDISIYGISQEGCLAAMHLVHSRLQNCESIVSNQLIATASVPVIKLEVNFDKLAVDLKIDPKPVGKIKTIKIDLVFEPSHESIPQTKKCAEFLKQKMIENPFLKPLAQVLKKYLQLKNLNSPFQGTISSYGIVIMILTLLQDMQRQIPTLQYPPMYTHQPTLEQQLGRVFTHFFMVYGDQRLFNTQNVMLSSQLEFEEIRRANAQMNYKNDLVVMDPTDIYNNVGKQTYNFANVQDQFSIQLQCLLAKFKDIQDRMYRHDSLVYERDILQRATSPQQPALAGQRKQPQTKQDNNVKVQQMTDSITSTLFSIQQLTKTALDRIIMVDTQDEDFIPIYRDEVEDKQKFYLNSVKQLGSLLQPFGESHYKQQHYNQYSQMQQNVQNLFFHPMKLGLMPQLQKHQPLQMNNNEAETPQQTNQTVQSDQE